MVSQGTVRAARPEDAEAFAACHLECWREAYDGLWGPERLAEVDVAEMAQERREQIEAGSATNVLAEENGEVIGVAISGPSRDENPQVPEEVYAIYIRQEHYGSGLADDLLQATIGDRPATLWVYRDNPRAAAFYMHRGFIQDGAERQDSEGILQVRMIRRTQFDASQA